MGFYGIENMNNYRNEHRNITDQSRVMVKYCERTIILDKMQQHKIVITIYPYKMLIVPENRCSTGLICTILAIKQDTNLYLEASFLMCTNTFQVVSEIYSGQSLCPQRTNCRKTELENFQQSKWNLNVMNFSYFSFRSIVELLASGQRMNILTMQQVVYSRTKLYVRGLISQLKYRLLQ